MWVLFLSLVLLGLFAFFITKYQKNDVNEDIENKEVKITSCDDSEYCCGAHEICEEGKIKRKNMIVEYFDDEELDRFRDRAADDYTQEEVDEFKEVLETLRAEEINDWLKSLNIRRISFPRSLIGLLSVQLEDHVIN